MATEAKVKMTWQQKIDQGLPLDPLEEVKADADFNFKEQLRQREARQEFEKRKANGRVAASDEEAGNFEEDTTQRGKK